MNQDRICLPQFRRGRSAAPLLAAGAACGVAWAAGLRGFMAELAGSDSTISWYGTFVQVLLPGAIVGALLGLAQHIRRTGGRRGGGGGGGAPPATPCPSTLPPYCR
jgi:hypothetical protein